MTAHESSLITAGSCVTFTQKLKGVLQLSKPRIILLFMITGMTGTALQGGLSLWQDPLAFFAVTMGILLTGACANSLNQYFDRDIDVQMERTKSKRPLPQGILTASEALVIAGTEGVVATALLYIFGGMGAAFWGVFTTAFYIGIYTLWLKRRTPHNIVIGGAAGATGPLIGWAAAAFHSTAVGFHPSLLEVWGVHAVPISLFALIFLWTPPHFWALALCIKDEYSGVSVPMLPVVAGVRVTANQILAYSLTLPLVSIVPYYYGFSSLAYAFVAVGLGLEFLRRAFVLHRAVVTSEFQPETWVKKSWGLFGYSIIYLFLIFFWLLAEGLFKPSLPKIEVGSSISKLSELFISSAAAAEKTPKELESIGIEEQFGAQVDLNLQFINEEGRVVALREVVNGRKPILLLPVYYRCPNLCNFFLNGMTDVLRKFPWTPGNEFQILTVSMDPREDGNLAGAKRESYLKSYRSAKDDVKANPREAASQGWHFWVEGSLAQETNREGIPPNYVGNVKKLLDQVGFRYRYSQEEKQFAHTAAAVVLTPEGRVSRYLYGIQFEPKDLKLALVEASGNRIGTFVDHLLLFCFHYDPKTRKYSLYATNLMRLTGLLTMLMIAGTLLYLWRRDVSRGNAEKIHV